MICSVRRPAADAHPFLPHSFSLSPFSYRRTTHRAPLSSDNPQLPRAGHQPPGSSSASSPEAALRGSQRRHFALYSVPLQSSFRLPDLLPSENALFDLDLDLRKISAHAGFPTPPHTAPVPLLAIGLQFIITRIKVVHVAYCVPRAGNHQTMSKTKKTKSALVLGK